MINMKAMNSISDEIVELEKYAKDKYIDEVDWEHIIGMFNEDDKLRYDLLNIIQNQVYGSPILSFDEALEHYIQNEIEYGSADHRDIDNMRREMEQILIDYHLSKEDFIK